jgi:hypothetical protein
MKNSFLLSDRVTDMEKKILALFLFRSVKKLFCTSYCSYLISTLAQSKMNNSKFLKLIQKG